MKKLFLTAFLSVMVLTLTVSAAPAETFLRLPVRVLSGDKAVEDLTIDDFNLAIAGQKTEITHFMKMNRTLAQANSSRNFFLAFNIKDYSSQIDDAIVYFVDNILKEGDTLLVCSPVKIYVIPTDNDKNTISETIKDFVKTDTLDYKENLDNDISMLNEMIKRYNTDTFENHGDISKYYMAGNWKQFNSIAATHAFIADYRREYLNYMNRFILPNMLKIQEVAGLLAEKNGPKWIINFQEEEIIPNYVNYKNIADVILEFAGLLMTTEAQVATRWIKSIEELNKMMLLTKNLPTKEITAALQNADISYNAILIKSPGERDPKGNPVTQDVDITFKDFSQFTGGTAVVTTGLLEGLDIIRKANSTYYDLIFKVRDQDKELAVSVGLRNKSKAKAYYKQRYTKKEMDTIFASMEDPGIQINGVDLKDQILKFSLSGHQLTTPGNTEHGLIVVLVNLFDEKNKVVYKTQKTLESQEETIECSLELPAKYQGDFTLSINAVDLHSLKSTQTNQYVKL